MKPLLTGHRQGKMGYEELESVESERGDRSRNVVSKILHGVSVGCGLSELLRIR